MLFRKKSKDKDHVDFSRVNIPFLDLARSAAAVFSTKRKKEHFKESLFSKSNDSNHSVFLQNDSRLKARHSVNRFHLSTRKPPSLAEKRFSMVVESRKPSTMVEQKEEKGLQKLRKMDLMLEPSEFSEDPSIVLRHNFLRQSHVVLNFVLYGETKKPCEVDEYDTHKWLGFFDYSERCQLTLESKHMPPYKFFPKKVINKEMNEVFRRGKNRVLRPAEEATIIACIDRIIGDLAKNPEGRIVDLLSENITFLVQAVIQETEFYDLERYPNCMRMIEWHLRIAFTVFAHSNQECLRNKKITRVLIAAQSKGIVLDIEDTRHPIVQYLLETAQKKDSKESKTGRGRSTSKRLRK